MIKLFLILGIAGTSGAAQFHDSSGVAEQKNATIASDVSANSTSRSLAFSIDSVTLHIEGMTCAGCVLGVRKVLTKLEGVTKADVSYETKRAVVTFDGSKVTVQQMIAAIKTLGYTATVEAEIPDARSGDR